MLSCLSLIWYRAIKTSQSNVEHEPEKPVSIVPLRPRWEWRIFIPRFLGCNVDVYGGSYRDGPRLGSFPTQPPLSGFKAKATRVVMERASEKRAPQVAVVEVGLSSRSSATAMLLLW